MANWYVSVTTGNDSSAGTSVATACATLSKAAELVAAGGSAGDVVYIAPGTYRGQVDMNGSGDGLDGTTAAPVKWIGDTNSEIFRGVVEPGIVRLTYTNEFDVAKQVSSTDMVLDLRNREHNHFYNLSLDGTTNGGSSGGYLVYGTNNTNYADGNRFYNCMFQGSNVGLRFVRLLEGCTFISCAYGAYSCYSINNSIFVGLTYGVFACALTQNCLFIGVNTSIWTSAIAGFNVNNTIIGGNIAAISQNANGITTLWNTALFGCNIGLKGNGTNRMHTSASYMQGVQKLGQAGHHDIIHYGGGLYNGDSWNSTNHENSDFIYRAAPVTLWSYNQIRDMAENLKPSVLTDGLKGRGTQAYYLGNDGSEHTPYTGKVQYDILGHPRDMGEPSSSHDKAYASSRDIGCWEYSDVYITSSAAGQVTMSIDGEGQFVIPIAVASGSSVTASADIKLKTTNALASLLKPQFILRQRVTEPSSSFSCVGQAYSYPSGTILELNTATSTAASDVYSNLTIKAGPMKRDTIVEAVLYSRTTGSASTSSISNIVIQ